MSKKNLSRTVTEGGSRTKWDRHMSHKEERMRERAYLREVKADLDNYYEYDIEGIRPIHKDYSDKTGPIFRWLESQIGRPWNDVNSEIANKFRDHPHIHNYLAGCVSKSLDEPVKPWCTVPDDPTTSRHPHDYYVDDAGILQKKRYVKRQYHEKVPKFDTNRLANWLNGRVIGQVGADLYWFVPADKSKKQGGTDKEWRIQWGRPKGYYYYGYPDGPCFEYLQYDITYKRDFAGNIVIEDGKMVEVGRTESWRRGWKPNLRQDRKLNKQELEFWAKVPTWYQTRILEESPTYPDPPKRELGYYW